MILNHSLKNRIVLAIILLGTFTGYLSAQTATVDPGFNPFPSIPLPSDANFSQVIQPDGKILVYNFQSSPLAGILRLNSDGSLDPTFSYCNCAEIGIGSVMVAPDGKIVLAGTTSPNHAKMVRLNANGSLDTSFSVFFASSGSPGVTGASYTLEAIQPDGKVIATLLHWGNIGGTWTAYSMARYNVDGSVDSSFSPPGLDGGHLVSTGVIIEPLPDGRMYMAISSGNHLGRSMTLSLRFANGAQDPSFTPFTRSLSGGFGISFDELDATSDGGVVAAGFFWPSMIGGPYNKNLYKFLPSGAVDPAFNPPSSYTSDGVQVLPDGKVLYSVVLTSSASKRIIRLGTDGSIDNTYVLDPAITGIINKWVFDSMGRPIFLATTTTGRRLVRLLADGGIDPTFNAAIGVAGNAALVAAQPDGKLLVAGNFSNMNGVPRNKLARVNADGSLDSTFNPGTGIDVAPSKMLVQPDGKIVAVGAFTNYNGTSVSGIMRLNSDGSLDTGFPATASGGAVHGAVLQSDGKIVIVGLFAAVNGVARTGIARLESSGALDATFNPVLTSSAGSVAVEAVVAESSGKLTFGGHFSTVNGISRQNIARVDASGATDSTFNAGTMTDTHGLWQQPDGKYVVTSDNVIRRRNSDGSADPGFSPPTFTHTGGSSWIEDVLFMPDGSMIVGGEFNTVGGSARGFMTRLRPNGTHDLSFVATGANARVTSLVSETSGKVAVAGRFNLIENTTRFGIARLNVPAIQVRTAFDFNGDGRADFSVYRPSSGVWYQLFSNGDPYGSPTFGLAGDIPIPADYDGDAKTDLAIYRPSNGQWWYRLSSDGSLRTVQLGGQAGDIPLPADIDNDGKADFVIFKTANSTWYRLTSTGVAGNKQFGLPGDKPVIGDFDGDGKADEAIFRPSTGDWWYSASSAGGAFRSTHWGQNGDIAAPADFDGDGKTDLAVFRPSNGAWYVLKSSDLSFIIQGFGVGGDRPAPADYDGDGRADIAVFRPSDGVWYVLQTNGGTTGVQWGVASDVAIPNAFVQ